MFLRLLVGREEDGALREGRIRNKKSINIVYFPARQSREGKERESEIKSLAA